MNRTISVVTSSEIGTKLLRENRLPEDQHTVAELNEELGDVCLRHDAQVVYLFSVVAFPKHVEN